MKAIYKTAEGEQLVKDKYRKFLGYWLVANTQFHLPTILPLLLLGSWGRRKAKAMMLGAAPAAQSGAAQAVAGFMALISTHFKQNLAKLARFSDAALQTLAMPILVILGAKDAMLDSAETLQRLQAAIPNLEVKWLPDAGHVLAGQTRVIDEYLRRQLLV